jgi:hypothetical protein
MEVGGRESVKGLMMGMQIWIWSICARVRSTGRLEKRGGARIERDRIREEQKRERERERRLESKDAAIGKKSKLTRDRGRDVSENIALGMASTGGVKGGEVMYDQRLFNQDKGMISGFAADDFTTSIPRVSSTHHPLRPNFTGPRKMVILKCMVVMQTNKWTRL